MTKAQIHFSNQVEQLLKPLKENLFPPGAKPFDKRLIVVPHLRLKDYLMTNLAKDPELQVAAGVEIVSLNKALLRISNKILPTKLELSLFLQYHLLPLIDHESALKNYFHCKSREKRIGPFCDAMAETFLRFAIYGKPQLPKWQEKIWKQFNWSFPKATKTSWQIHLFGFSFLSEYYLDLFKGLGAEMYLFSPCEIFWGDFYSAREKSFLEQHVPEKQLDIFVESFADQNSLLGSWGRMGRQMLFNVEERNILTREYYIPNGGSHSLSLIQNDFLQGACSEINADRNILAFSASTPFREIEILKDQIYQLFDEEGLQPSDIQVFASDIGKYAPYIRAVFNDIAHAIYDLPLADVDVHAKGFGKLIELPKHRFQLEEVLQVLANTKFDLDIGLCRKWLEAANIRWGYSKKQREAFYLEDMEEIPFNCSEGTWMHGFKRLVLGLGTIRGGEEPLPIISVTEIEMFNTLYTTLESLVDDLAPLYDQTRWTISTWLRYFACLFESYFSIDPSHDLYKELLRLAASYDHLDDEEIPYVGIERILVSLLNKKNKTLQASHLQSVRFSSLAQGAIQPSKAICLLGMQEEAFPRKRQELSISPKETIYCPTKTEEDRYLFLQALLSAREFFQVSYIRDEEGKLGASLLIQELLSQIKGSEIIHHPAQPYDPNYFGGELISYNQDSFELAKSRQAPPSCRPLIQSFFEPSPFPTTIEKPKVIEVQKLAKFAKHPLRYYLHEVLGIYPEYGNKIDEEYLLSPIVKKQLVQDSLEQGVDQVLETAKKKGQLPHNLLTPLAKEQVQKEVDEWQEAMEFFGVTRIRTEKIDLQVGDIRIIGKQDSFSEKGILVRGKNCLEDQIRYWPLGLIAKKLGLPLLGIKDKEPMEMEGSLEEYLDYFHLAHTYPSPLLPAFGKALLMGSPKDLHKELKKIEDDVWGFLYFRDPMPDARIIHNQWHPYLQNVFGRVDANV